MDHWPLHARQWGLVGPPLRPSPADVALVEAEVARWSSRRARPPRGLLLGVTPELATMAWPAGATLEAIDRSADMIAAIFPTTGLPARTIARLGEWLSMPHPARAFDIVLGDGCLTCLPFPEGYRALARELRRVIADDGLVLLRVFAAPERRETVAEVAAALGAGQIASFHALKWRIAMAVQPDDRTVRVVDIWRAFEALVPDRSALTRWPPAIVATIDVYRDSDLVYSFPTAAEIVGALDADLVEISRHAAGADGYPTLALRAR